MPRLSDALAMVPDMGKLEASAEQGGALAFVFGQRGDAGSAPGGGLHLRQPIWQAVIDWRSPEGSWLLDLETLQPVERTDREDDPVAAEPERYVALPRADEEFQRGLARDFTESRIPTQLESVAEQLEKQNWFSLVMGLFDDHDLREAWKFYRRSQIVAQVLAWGKQHGVRPEALTFKRTERVGQRSGSTPRAVVSAERIRQLVHRAIDLMPGEEVARLPIPATYLIMANDEPR